MPITQADAGTIRPYTVRIARGSIYLDRDLCELYFPGIEAVALLLREGCVYLMPLRGTAVGGLLLKHRNAHGDRVVHATEFLSQLGIGPDAAEKLVVVQWDSQCMGLRLEGVTTHVPAYSVRQNRL